MSRATPATPKRVPRTRKLSSVELDTLIEEATVDAHDESEQAVGFYTMLEEHLAVPFQTEVLGMKVTVERIELTADDQVFAVCARNKSRQRVSIADLPLPDPPPSGRQWIDAYRRWRRGR